MPSEIYFEALYTEQNSNKQVQNVQSKLVDRNWGGGGGAPILHRAHLDPPLVQMSQNINAYCECTKYNRPVLLTYSNLWMFLPPRLRLCLSSFPRVETRFNTQYQNAHANALAKRLSRVVAFIIELYREYESRGRPCHCAAALRSLNRRAEIMFRARVYAYKSVGDIKAFQNNFAFIISTETCFWLKRVSDRTFLGCVYHLSQVRNTFQYPLSKRVKNKRKAFLTP